MGLKSRAAFKLLEMDAKYKIFKAGQVVVDLGYAPGSWSQVAQERTKPTGRVLGIDLIPAQPPRGVSTIQGNFLSPHVQELTRQFLAEAASRKTPAASSVSQPPRSPSQEPLTATGDGNQPDTDASSLRPDAVDTAPPIDVVPDRPSYIELERTSAAESEAAAAGDIAAGKPRKSDGRMVDVLLSDMSAPWPQTAGFSVKTLSNPYIRMMNTSGTSFRDHTGSMDLCYAALSFANTTLRSGGNFICKFYQGSDDKILESRLKKLFVKVHREKPESSRSESKEAYFVALRRKADIVLAAEDFDT